MSDVKTGIPANDGVDGSEPKLVSIAELRSIALEAAKKSIKDGAEVQGAVFAGLAILFNVLLEKFGEDLKTTQLTF